MTNKNKKKRKKGGDILSHAHQMPVSQINKNSPSISLCMIVKDEECCLGRCLKSVQDFVDEIIVVDTGSTDRTCEIAQGYGARIYHHPWENDFSKHRNQSLSYATGEWIFQLDADEELFAEDGPRLREIVREGKADYYHCRFYDMKQDGSVHGIFYLIRLFKNGMGMTYTRKVHNQLIPKGKEGYSDLRIRHYGYDLSQERMEAKHLRTTTLLEKTIAADPDDAYALFQLSSSYSMHKEFDKAVEYGETALDLMRRYKLENDFFMTAFHTVAHGYYALGNSGAAKSTAMEALSVFPMHLDMCHLLAYIYFQEHDLDRSREMSHRYLSIYEPLTRNPALIRTLCHSYDKRHEIYFGLALINFFEKDFETAEAYFLKSFEDGGDPLIKAESIYRLFLSQGMTDKGEHWLRIAYETGMKNGEIPVIFQEQNNLFLRIGKYYLSHKDLNNAAECLQKAMDEYLNADEQLDRRLLQLQIYWQLSAIDELLTPLESLLDLFHMNRGRKIDSFEDLGRTIYDIADEFCRRRQWSHGETALQLALQISPDSFDQQRFSSLLDPSNS